MAPPDRMTKTYWTGLALLLAVAPGRAQDLPPRDLLRPLEFLAGRDDNLFSLRRSQDDIHEWEKSLKELEDGELTAAVERLHRLLQNEFGGVAPVGPDRYIGQRLAIINTLANLSPTASEAYETLVRREAGHLVERPLHTLLPEQLHRLAVRYPTSQAGRAARLRLGDLALERGEAQAAMGHFRAAFDAARIGSTQERTIWERIQATQVLLAPERARAEAQAGRLPEPATEVLAVMPEISEHGGWRAVGGGAEGSALMTEPFGRPASTGPLEVHAPGFTNRPRERYAMMPVGDLGGIYVNTGRRVVAFDPLRRAVAWRSLRPMPQSQEPYYDDQGEVNPDMVLAASYGDDVVVAPLQVPDETTTVTFHNNIPIMSKIPQRRLFGIERHTGKLLWSHFDQRGGPRTRRFEGHDVCGPPLVAGDTVYAPTHDRSGAIAFSVTAYDLATGHPRWRRLVCSSQQEVNMFGNERMEFAASPLCLSQGTIFGTSNLGVAFAVDAATGELRWVTSYEVVKMPMTQIYGQRSRPVYFRNNAPVTADGVVCLTPLDSPFALGIDTVTGRTLWRFAADAPVDRVENDVRWLPGAIGDEFVLTGRGAVAIEARGQAFGPGLHPRVRQLVSPEIWRANSGPGDTGRPGITKDHVWVSRMGGITGFDRGGRAIPFSRQIRSPLHEGGNLLFVDGIALTLCQGSFEAFLDRRAIQTQVEQSLQRAPGDPAIILRLASLRASLLTAGAAEVDYEALTWLYRSGLEASLERGLKTDHPVRATLQRELHALTLRAARAAILSDAPDVLEKLAEARTTAPDLGQWMEVQQMVLDRCEHDPKLLAAELDRLEGEASGALLELPGGPQSVRAYVLYRRTSLPASPAARVALWQELIEKHPAATFDDETMSVRAARAIDELIAEHGAGCYAAVQQRAENALRTAGEDIPALRAIGRHFPNSSAARRARDRLLDNAVGRGALEVVCDALMAELTNSTDDPNPGVLRRSLEAARNRGNFGLARAIADRLAAHRNKKSDWPADEGRTYGAVLEALSAELTTPPMPHRLGLPHREVVRIRPRSVKESFRRLDVTFADGFAVPADVPLYVPADRDLLAYDVYQQGAPVLFSTPVGFLDQVVLCGTTLIVCEFERVVAFDYRSGEVRWERILEEGAFAYCLGVREGVLHLSTQPPRNEGRAPILGVEPLTGTVLFERTLTCEHMRPVPKPIGNGQLLAVEGTGPDDTRLLRLDPLTGRTLATIALSKVLPEGDDLLDRIYPKTLCGDDERCYVPIDGAFGGVTSRLFAITDRGEIAWQWQGLSGSTLAMTALRGESLVIVESSSERAGRVLILRATDGEVLRSVPLGHEITLLNWQRDDLQTPAPPALLLSDNEVPNQAERRLFCIGIDEGVPSFIEPLSLEFADVERQPHLGPDFLTFGVRARRSETFRVYALRLADRSGAFPGGQKFTSHRLEQTYLMGTVGPYTVVYCTGYLSVLGPEER